MYLINNEINSMKTACMILLMKSNRNYNIKLFNAFTDEQLNMLGTVPSWFAILVHFKLHILHRMQND